MSRRESATDVASAVTLELDKLAPGALSHLPARDPWKISGGSLRILLYGKDTFEAAAFLQEVGLSGSAKLRVDTNSDLLVAPAREE